MGELETIAQFIQGIANDIGYTGAAVIVLAFLVLRNQSKMVEALVESNNAAAKQRSTESEQDSKVLNTVLTRVTNILDEMNKGQNNILNAFERFGFIVNTNNEKQDEILDEFKTHENAALHRHEAALKALQKASLNVSDETVKVIKDAHKTTRQGINHVAENALSTHKGMQGVNLTMANLVDMSKKEFEELRKLIQSEFADVKQLLANLASCDNKADIEKATQKITEKLSTIEDLVKKDETPDGKTQ